MKPLYSLVFLVVIISLVGVEPVIAATTPSPSPKPTPQVLGSITIAPNVAAATKFSIDKKYYPSPVGPNFLPDGVLITTPGHPNVYYVKNGKKSWIIPGILNKWLGENHYFKQEIIISISRADFDRYPQVASVNPAYIGKILVAPNGTQYFIDDKNRKREISPQCPHSPEDSRR